MAEMKRYRIGSLLFWYDPADPLLPAGAEPVDEPKPKAEPKAEAKAVKPKNKAVKAENK